MLLYVSRLSDACPPEEVIPEVHESSSLYEQENIAQGEAEGVRKGNSREHLLVYMRQAVHLEEEEGII